MIDLASRDCVCLLSDLILSSKERESQREGAEGGSNFLSTGACIRGKHGEHDV
jgi:hypothetical protein